MTAEDHNRDDANGFVEPLSFEQARRLAAACDFIEKPHTTDTDASARPVRSPIAFRKRLGYLRAAFVGDVRMSFLVLIVLLSVWLTGWIAASAFHARWEREQLRREIYQDFADDYNDMLRGLSAVREDPEMQARFSDFIKEFHEALMELRAKHEGLNSRTEPGIENTETPYTPSP